MVRLGTISSQALLIVAALSSMVGQNVLAQGTGNNNNPFGQGGIEIDADRVLRVRQVDPQLRETQLEIARKNHKVNVAPLRKVSLNRYEQAVAKAVDKGGLDDMLLSAAGITRIEYLMFLPGSKDIVIAGPAEEVTRDANGYTVGLKSGRPTLRLDDLIVALRTYGPNSSAKADYISCSIDPTKEGLQQMQQLINSLGGQIPPNSSVEGIANSFKNALGHQTVTLHGVPTTTRFAQTLVEADYRMKLIGIGLEQPPIQMRSWIDRVSGNSGSASSLQRWWFEPDYSGVKVSTDGYVLKLEGQGVKLVGEQEHVDRSGNRNASGKVGDAASRGFTKEFTQKYEKIADVAPVYHVMRNLFDITVVAAYIRQSNMYSASEWNLGIFASEDRLPVEVSESPEQVETAVNAVWKNGQLMTPIGGGVMIDSRKIIKKDGLAASDELVAAQEKAAAPSDLKEGQWWWD